MLGVSGVIYNQFLEDMQKLGVTGVALTSLAKKLHFFAINHVKQIWKQRAAMVITLSKCRRANWSNAKRCSWKNEPDHRKKHKWKHKKRKG